jgi:hypothetical protein
VGLFSVNSHRRPGNSSDQQMFNLLAVLADYRGNLHFVMLSQIYCRTTGYIHTYIGNIVCTTYNVLRAGRSRGRSSSPIRVKNFLISTSSRPALGPTQFHIQWVPEAISAGVKRSGCEADHSLPISTEVKKMRIYTFTPPHTLSWRSA